MLPFVPLTGRQADGAGEQDAPVGGPHLGELLLQPLKGPELALTEVGSGPVGGFQGGEAPFEVGYAVFQLLHVFDIT
ncbi:hypothetical protein GCM10023323_33690 [Streptomyces thinghirensis]|uniref:Uncharacterized protein n=1 Tax=Streptomyces thinghirensis TaxID=551547 RepID=A0ABP9T6X1_9ACTN